MKRENYKAPVVDVQSVETEGGFALSIDYPGGGSEPMELFEEDDYYLY